MADNKLRLDIETSLNNAGLKATKEQLDGIESALRRTNQNEGFGGLDKSVTKLPGKLGKISESLGGVGKAMGLVGAAVAAFKEGWEIGTWINDKVITPLFGIKDAQ